ncbi:phosphotransferase [Streptomyces osmaniensis]|uniref:Aminoglycoside phosphotransferase domain-containing protein n=1 Tax=Streptomyces osmaniensis TaxID=593134 RepID=A0ABP6XQ65_9ACTN
MSVSTASPLAFPTPASAPVRAERAHGRARAVLRRFAPDYVYCRDGETLLGTNCVIIAVPGPRGTLALRYEPADDAESRDAWIRELTAPYVPDLVARPLRGDLGGLSVPAGGGARFTCSPWIQGRAWRTADAHPAAVAALFRALGDLHTALGKASKHPMWPTGRSGQVYWDMAEVDAAAVRATTADLPRPVAADVASLVEEAVAVRRDLAVEACHGDAHLGNVLQAETPCFIDFDFTRREAGGGSLDFGVLLHRVLQNVITSRRPHETTALIDTAATAYAGGRTFSGVRTAFALAALESVAKRLAIPRLCCPGDPDESYWQEVDGRHRGFLVGLARMARLVRGDRRIYPNEEEQGAGDV